MYALAVVAVMRHSGGQVQQCSAQCLCLVPLLLTHERHIEDLNV